MAVSTEVLIWSTSNIEMSESQIIMCKIYQKKKKSKICSMALKSFTWTRTWHIKNVKENEDVEESWTGVDVCRRVGVGEVPSPFTQV